MRDVAHPERGERRTCARDARWAEERAETLLERGSIPRLSAGLLHAVQLSLSGQLAKSEAREAKAAIDRARSAGQRAPVSPARGGAVARQEQKGAIGLPAQTGREREVLSQRAQHGAAPFEEGMQNATAAILEKSVRHGESLETIGIEPTT